MIILDTNVVSEPLRPRPDEAVLQWLDAQDPQTLFLTSVGMGELLAGVEALPADRRRNELQRAFDAQVLPLFAGRILAFDEHAARVRPGDPYGPGRRQSDRLCGCGDCGYRPRGGFPSRNTQRA